MLRVSPSTLARLAEQINTFYPLCVSKGCLAGPQWGHRGARKQPGEARRVRRALDLEAGDRRRGVAHVEHPDPADPLHCFGVDDGEGYVHIHRGMHGIGDLAPEIYDWRNPVAAITITRAHSLWSSM